MVEPGKALDVAVQRAARLAAQPPLALAWTKAAIDAAAESSTRTALLLEQLAYAALNRSDDDVQAGRDRSRDLPPAGPGGGG